MKISLKESILQTLEKIKTQNKLAQEKLNKRVNITQDNLNAVNAHVDENTESIDVTTDTLDTVMGVVLPAQAEALDEVAETLDTLMSTVIPELIGME